MQFAPLAIPEVIQITPRRFADARGFFAETYRRSRFVEAGIDAIFVQDNHSLSREVGTIRGLHLQIVPAVQGKLVRAVRGAIWDAAVDVRHGSPTFGQHVAAELSAENGCLLWIPGGFLHGFCTLAPDTEVTYKVTAEYDPAAERGVRWDDTDLALPWPVAPAHAVLSDKDRAFPPLASCAAWFSYPAP